MPIASSAALALAAGLSVGAIQVQLPESMRAPSRGSALSVAALGPTSIRRLIRAHRSMVSTTRSMTDDAGDRHEHLAGDAGGARERIGRRRRALSGEHDSGKGLFGRHAVVAGQALFVHAIALRNASADGFDDVAHAGIVLEDPRHFDALDAARDRCVANRVNDREREPGTETRALEFLSHTHQRHARTVRVAHLQTPQQFQPAERQQASVEIGDGFVDVRQHDDERGGFAVDFGDLDEVVADDQQHLVADRQELIVRERHEAPVVLPRVVEDGAHRLQVAVAILAIDRTDHHATRRGACSTAVITDGILKSGSISYASRSLTRW